MERTLFMCLIVALLALLPSLASSRAHAQPGDPTNARIRAEKLYAEAVTAMQKQEYASACPKLEEAVQLVPSGVGAKLTLAQCYQGQQRLASAWKMFLLAEKAAGEAGQTERQTSARASAEALKPKLAQLTIVVPDAVQKLPEIEVKCDGSGVSPQGVSLPVDTGQHTIVATARGMLPWKKTIAIKADGVSETITVDGLSPAASARPKPLSPGCIEPRPPYYRLSEPIPYTAGDDVLPGYHVESRTRKGLAAGGISTFVPFYLLSILGASIADDRAAAILPVIGPFIAAGQSEDEFDLVAMHFVISGIGQLTGAVLMIASVAAPEQVQTRDKASAGWIVVPAAGPGMAGLSLVGAL